MINIKVILLNLALLLFIPAMATATATSEKAAETEPVYLEPGAKEFEELEPKNFPNSTNIDNKWWPLTPGSKLTLEGSTKEDGEVKTHTIVFIVTDLTKMFGKVRARVLYLIDISDDEVVEKELAFFAQDKFGNVWHLGELSEVYEGGDLVGGQAWFIGYPKEAKAGITVPGDPKLGTLSISQGYAPPPFNWTDRGRVSKMGQKVSVPAGNFEDVLIIEEFDALSPGGFQLKSYAPGVGVVHVGWRGADETAEVLELIKHEKLSPKELAKIRMEALELEERASAFGKLPPAK